MCIVPRSFRHSLNALIRATLGLWFSLPSHTTFPCTPKPPLPYRTSALSSQAPKRKFSLLRSFSILFALVVVHHLCIMCPVARTRAQAHTRIRTHTRTRSLYAIQPPTHKLVAGRFRPLPLPIWWVHELLRRSDSTTLCTWRSG